jgi:hypothetical protein
MSAERLAVGDLVRCTRLPAVASRRLEHFETVDAAGLGHTAGISESLGCQIISSVKVPSTVDL